MVYQSSMFQCQPWLLQMELNVDVIISWQFAILVKPFAYSMHLYTTIPMTFQNYQCKDSKIYQQKL